MFKKISIINKPNSITNPIYDAVQLKDLYLSSQYFFLG